MREKKCANFPISTGRLSVLFNDSGWFVKDDPKYILHDTPKWAIQHVSCTANGPVNETELSKSVSPLLTKILNPFSSLCPPFQFFEGGV